ncbi:MAG: hypothetical protein C5B58_10935 [Acidobacteria bacterium]|nr:MAG: hypothetical protein C5B58_10935 [Acidobacteriota bacterium]
MNPPLVPVPVRDAIRRGCAVIPTRSDKRPLIASWKLYQTQKPSGTEIVRWAQQNPATWAIVTGEVSGIITLDFDGEAGARTMRELGLRPHRRTPSGNRTRQLRP